MDVFVRLNSLEMLLLAFVQLQSQYQVSEVILVAFLQVHAYFVELAEHVKVIVSLVVMFT